MCVLVGGTGTSFVDGEEYLTSSVFHIELVCFSEFFLPGVWTHVLSLYSAFSTKELASHQFVWVMTGFSTQ
jgi:hypothetical protein